LLNNSLPSQIQLYRRVGDLQSLSAEAEIKDQPNACIQSNKHQKKVWFNGFTSPI